MVPTTMEAKRWWKEGVVYQIYPASYQDSNGDGMGDIRGIISRLDYIKHIGVDIIWLSPFYASPQVDMGYDISDYQDVYEPYGNLADVKELIYSCHARNMRIIFDLVVNHTSNQHRWFLESKSSMSNPKRNWYIWRPPKYDKEGNRKPPCNWRGCFGGSAWAWDDTTQEYYLHLFAPEQPDLNWENPEVREAVYREVMKFWLDLGVDGFRIDVVNMYSKNLEFKDAPIVDPGSEWQPAHDFFCNGPRMHEFLKEMNSTVLTHYDAMTVGELIHTPDPDHVLRYVGSSAKQLNMVFQMDLVTLGFGHDAKHNIRNWLLTDFKTGLEKWQCFPMGNDGWTTIFLENHDQARSISRFGSDDPLYRDVSGKMLAILLSTLTGTLYMYQGQEIGMINAPKSWPIEEYKDVESINYYEEVKERSKNDKQTLDKALQNLQAVARDHARTPFQWDDSEHAGFTTGKPWMRVNDIYPDINAKKQLGDKNSLLSFWRSVLDLRRKYGDLFVYGDFTMFDKANTSTVTYVKQYQGELALVTLNFTKDRQMFVVPSEITGDLELLVSNVRPSEEDHLGPYEARVYLVK